MFEKNFFKTENGYLYTKFSTKKKLRALLIKKEDTITNLTNQNILLLQTINEFRKLNDAMPPDCKRGPWCKACEFVKEVKVFRPLEPGKPACIVETLHVCGKGESCNNFVQKEKNHENV